MKTPFPKQRPRRQATFYEKPRNPSGKNSRRYVQLRLTSWKRRPFFER